MGMMTINFNFLSPGSMYNLNGLTGVHQDLTHQINFILSMFRI